MKYTPEEIRAIVEFFQNHRATRSAHILEDMLKAVETLHGFYKMESYDDVKAAAALAPFDFTTEEEVKP